jgi:hypothetical protein
MKLLFTSLIVAGALSLEAQQNVGIGTTTPAASAQLHINSTTKGLLIPRLTSAQRTAIASPATGLQVYDTNTNTFWYYNGGAWTEIGSGGGGNSYWEPNGSGSIYNNNTGNIGIGVQYPWAKLTVNGDGYFTGTRISYDYSEQGGYYFNGGAINLTTPVSGIESKAIRVDGNSIQSYTVDTDDPSVDDYAAPFTINPLGGNVGIGTPNPLPNSKLTLQTDGDYATAMTIRNPSGSASFETYIGGPINGNTISLGTQGNMPIAIFTNGLNRVFINSLGNVGIGTDNPTYKLSVRGNIRSNEVVVETGWADYVFADNYKLKTLDEVERFIQKNKHLPNIPSAKEIENNGLHIGDVQKRMMEKIEELTLYIIQLKKEMAVIQSSIK